MLLEMHQHRHCADVPLFGYCHFPFTFSCSCSLPLDFSHLQGPCLGWSRKTEAWEGEARVQKTVSVVSDDVGHSICFICGGPPQACQRCLGSEARLEPLRCTPKFLNCRRECHSLLTSKGSSEADRKVPRIRGTVRASSLDLFILDFQNAGSCASRVQVSCLVKKRNYGYSLLGLCDPRACDIHILGFRCFGSFLGPPPC